MTENQQDTSKKAAFTWDLSEKPQFVMLMAHGAGSTMDQPFLKNMGKAINQHRGHALRFNFPYVLQGRKTPGSPKSSIEVIGEMVELSKKTYPGLPVFLSGKSYGGRMSSHWVAENPDPIVKGLIYFGFPLHPPGKEGVERANHLPKVMVPQLFVQGTNDLLANLDLLKGVLSSLKQVTLEVIEGADHSFKVPKKSGKSNMEIEAYISNAVVNWINPLL